jgi:hypothetical protein
VDLVIARCAEDLAWVRNVAPGIRTVVYNKGTPGAWPEEILLPNSGREAHTFLHHIVENYDHLAGVTAFCQGKPFDHAFDFHNSLARLAREGLQNPEGFEWFGHIIDTDDATGSRLFQSWSKNPEKRPLVMEDFWRQIFDVPCPARFTFACGGQFALTRERIRRQPLSYYQRACDLSVSHPDAPHFFERVWNRVFDVSGFPPGLLDGRTTLYLKPIRRIMDGAAAGETENEFE